MQLLKDVAVVIVYIVLLVQGAALLTLAIPRLVAWLTHRPRKGNPLTIDETECLYPDRKGEGDPGAGFPGGI